MKSLEIASLLFDRGTKAAFEALSQARASGAFAPGTVQSREALNFLMIALICQKNAGQLTLGMLEEAGAKLENGEVPVGSAVVYRMLLFDLASAINVSLTLPGSVTATGSELDWELLRAFGPATSSFAKRAQQLEQLYAKSRRKLEG